MGNGDFNKPSTSSTKANVWTETTDLCKTLATMSGLAANPPDGYVRYSSTNKCFEKYNSGTASWSALDLTLTGITKATNADNIYDGTTYRAASATPGANKGVIANASGKLPAGWGGAASTLSTLDANSRVVEPVNLAYDGVGNRAFSQTPDINEVVVTGANGGINLTPDINSYMGLGRYSAGAPYGIISAYYAANPNGTGLRLIVKTSGGAQAIALQAEADGTLKASSGNYLTDANVSLKFKVVDIGNWNMDLTAFVNIAHGIASGKTAIIGALAKVRDDSNALYYSLIGTQSDGNAGGEVGWDDTNISLGRVTGGFFDSINFDTASYDRGDIVVIYIG